MISHASIKSNNASSMIKAMPVWIEAKGAMRKRWPGRTVDKLKGSKVAATVEVDM